MKQIKLIVIGASAGGVEVVKQILSGRFRGEVPPIVIVLHRSEDSKASCAFLFSSVTRLKVKEAEEKEALENSCVYVAPAGYHLLIEADMTFSFSMEDKVNWARPSIDVLFESAAEALGPSVLGIVLSGANQDGAAGLRRIEDRGGLVVVQDPTSAQYAEMPRASAAATKKAKVLSVSAITDLLTGENWKEEYVS
ncbi:MAG: chemotaxis protein CheB [Oligoflexales bacterium]